MLHKCYIWLVNVKINIKKSFSDSFRVCGKFILLNKFFCLPIIFLLTLIYITLYFVMLKLNIFFWIMYTLYKTRRVSSGVGKIENKTARDICSKLVIYIPFMYPKKRATHVKKTKLCMYSSLLVWCVFFSSTIYIFSLANIHVDLVVTYTDHKSNKRWGKMFLIAFVTCFILVRENGQQNCHDDQETEVYRF